ncbi:hypothetical protein MFU01_16960 [Myxococcus fulvus]|uniref:Uncharacterized protein n=1 Tax=Myxococcus fulvus TaxID=33 RepID=A0A511SXN1_MYXFU|nr:hypothetical protein MFU01_16960 [Myxococcus fulvus]
MPPWPLATVSKPQPPSSTAPSTTHSRFTQVPLSRALDGPDEALKREGPAPKSGGGPGCDEVTLGTT